MRIVLVALLAASLLAAWQAERRTYVFDPEGRRQFWSGEAMGERRSTSIGRDLNGREAKVEEVEEKILRDEGGVKVVERIIRRFDQNGRPLTPEKEVVESIRQAGGVTQTSVTTYEADLNGRLRPARRAITEERELNDRIQSETRIERQTISGAFATVERRVSERRENGGLSENEETTFLPDANGRFQQAARRVARSAKENGAVREQVDEYEVASTGQLKLSRQSVARTEKDASGAERRVIDVFGPGAPGRTPEAGVLALRERQIIEVKPTAQGAVETYSIQRPELHGRGQLGDPVKISETVCTGKCVSAPPSPPPGEVKK